MPPEIHEVRSTRKFHILRWQKVQREEKRKELAEDFLAAMDKEDEACQGRTSQNVTRLGRRDEPGDMR